LLYLFIFLSFLHIYIYIYVLRRLNILFSLFWNISLSFPLARMTTWIQNPIYSHFQVPQVRICVPWKVWRLKYVIMLWILFFTIILYNLNEIYAKTRVIAPKMCRLVFCLLNIYTIITGYIVNGRDHNLLVIIDSSPKYHSDDWKWDLILKDFSVRCFSNQCNVTNISYFSLFTFVTGVHACTH